MKKHLLFASLIIAAIPLFSQVPNFAWAKYSTSISNPHLSNVGAVAVDTINDVVYATGSFNGGGINFGSGDLQTSSAECAYLVKYNLSGTLIWAKVFNANGDNNATGVGVDNAGNVYVTGYSQSDTVRYGSQFLLNSHDNSADHTVGYVVKFDAAGNAQWIRGSSGGGGVVCEAIAVDGAGNSYITGHVVDASGTFMGQTTTQSGFYAKISSTGTLTWFQQSSPSGALICQGTSIALDNSGNLVICGTYAANINFGSVALAYTGSGGTYRRFVAKMNTSAGTCAWAMAGISTGIDYAYDVAADLQNNVFVTGFLNESTPNGNQEKQFIEKLNPSGTSQWIKTYSKNIYSDITSVVTDKQGNVFAAFNISDTTVYGTYTVATMSPMFANSTVIMALVKFDSNGTVLYAKGTTDPVVLSFAQSFALAVDQGGDLFVGGSITNECKFDNTDIHPGGQNAEFVMAKIGNNVTGGGGNGTGIRTQSGSQNLSVYPNPASSALFIAGLNEKATITMTDISGKTVLSTQASATHNSIDISELANGAYILEVNTSGVSAHQKIIVSK